MLKFSVIGGIFLTWFADSVLFTIMVKTEFQDGIETPQELIERDMTLSTIFRVEITQSVN